MQSQLLRNANQYLRDELQKRWPLRYKTRRSGLWVAQFPDNTYSNFHLNEYGRCADKTKAILRLNDLFEVALPRGCTSFISGNRGGNLESLELSFLAGELEVAVPWLLDNYLSAKSVPDWLHQPLAPKIKLGVPLRYDLWSEKAHQTASERRRAAEESFFQSAAYLQ